MATRKSAAAPSRPPDIRSQAITEVPAIPEFAIASGEDGQGILHWMANLVPFFTAARNIEENSKATLLQARQFTMPVTAEEDAAIQLFCKGNTTERKQAEDFWDICGKMSRLHRSLTSARSRPVENIEQATKIATNLHNRYVDAEKARVAREVEAERQRIAQEAQEQRDRELAALEQAALKAEATSADLSDRERAFVQRCYAGIGADLTSERWLNAAAKSCGFKQDGYGVILYGRRKITDAIDGLKRAANVRLQAEAVKELPLETRAPEELKPNIIRAPGAADRTTWGAEVMDEAALMAAVLDPVTRVRLGIPLDILMIDTCRVNDYGKQLREKIDAWPGVRHKKNTRVV